MIPLSIKPGISPLFLIRSTEVVLGIALALVARGKNKAKVYWIGARIAGAIPGRRD